MARCLVGCGSNLGGRRDFLDRAVELLRYMPGISVVRVSRYRDTRPIGGPPGQAAFLNGACLLETDLAPRDVLDVLVAVENTLHRERQERWGPRTVDLDLLLYDQEVIESDSLTVPHPRMATRRFVLEPSVEIAPDLVHPLAGCTLERLLESISAARPHVAVVGVPGSGAEEVAEAVAQATLARLLPAPPAYAAAIRLAGEPSRSTSAAPWIEAVEAAARPLGASRWPNDPLVTVADYWLHTIRLAAEPSLASEPATLFAARFGAAIRETVPPQVAILLVASPDLLRERSGRQGATTGHSVDDGSGAHLERRGDDGRGGGRQATACVAEEARFDGLVRLQERLIATLRRPDPTAPLGPRAVVTIAADDIGQAIQEAVAAVEALA